MSQSCPPKSGICSEPVFTNSKWAAFSKHSIITVEEKGKKYVVQNQNGECVAKIKVDGGLINEAESSKADYLILRCDHNAAYIVELKGKNIAKACNQILSTIALMPALNNCRLNARIICSRRSHPQIKSSQENTLDQLCRSKSGSLQIQTRLIEEKF